MATEIRILQRGDERILMNVRAGVFDNPVDPKLASEFLADHRHHIAVAIEEGFVVGFASGVHYIHPDKAPELWINEVGLAPEYRGRGLGKAVLNALLDVGRSHNCTIAWTLTYRSNPRAMALYSALGGTEGADDSGLSEDLVGYMFPLSDASTP